MQRNREGQVKLTFWTRLLIGFCNGAVAIFGYEAFRHLLNMKQSHENTQRVQLDKEVEKADPQSTDMQQFDKQCQLSKDGTSLVCIFLYDPADREVVMQRMEQKNVKVPVKFFLGNRMCHVENEETLVCEKESK